MKTKQLAFFTFIFIYLLTILFLNNLYATNIASGRVIWEFDLSKQGLGKEIKLWVPYPTSDEYQKISDVKIYGDFKKSKISYDPFNGNYIFFTNWEPNQESKKLIMEFYVNRQEVVKKNFPKKETKLDKNEFSNYLQPTSLGPIDGIVKDYAMDITKGKKTILEKARAIHDWIIDTMYRDPKVIGCGEGDVCTLLLTKGGKCTDIHSVFVALSRAVGVPAKEVFGLRLGKKDGDDITGGQHCWAEFYLPNYGWVPVDPSDVLKAILTEKLDKNSQRVKELREYFFGAIEPYRFRISEGRDLILIPPQKGNPLNTFQYPYAEVDGVKIDFYDPKNFVYKFTYQVN